jgi:hypothetical protein
MYYSRKLRPDNSITGFIPAILAIVIFAIIYLFFGFRIGIAAVSIFFLIYSLFSLLAFFRTHNPVYGLGFLFQVLVALVFSTSSRGPFPLRDIRVHQFFSIFGFVVLIWLVYLMYSRKGKWKGTEVFELAAHSIEESPDGFTERPKPAGRMEYTKDELMGFAEYLKRNLIAMPFREDDRIVFVPTRMGDEFYCILSPQSFRNEKTWIAFDFRGNVTVFISKKDYHEYREELSFDQLCENMGKLFMSFMEYHKKGDADRIVFQLNELKIKVTS